MDISKVHPTGQRILVRRYVKPEQVRGIYIPDAWRPDNNQCFWEVVRSSVGADRLLGVRLLPDDLLITEMWSGTYLPGTWEPSGDYFMLDAEQVRMVRRWKEETADAEA